MNRSSCNNKFNRGVQFSDCQNHYDFAAWISATWSRTGGRHGNVQLTKVGRPT